MPKDVFYVTTPIYYPNDVPHIGHAYTTVATDFVARYHRLRGQEAFFLTGTDGHEKAVTKLLTAVYENGRDDIYLGTYEGLYCVSCEAYYTEDELVNGLCPIHASPVEALSEENYFFRLSAYQDRLLEHYERTPSAIEPEARRNEVLSTIRGGLRDFSISRTSFAWGVPIPWDPAHVTYVWFDALTNYITAAGYADDPGRFARVWPADVHFIGKDIIRFHAIYWPAMLMAAGVEPPSQVWAHGFLLVGGEKMSKTRLTGIHPKELVDHFGVDAYRYYFLREIAFGQDGSFSWESMVAQYNADLANGLGVLAMLATSFDGAVSEATVAGAAGALPDTVASVIERYSAAMDEVALTTAVTAVWDVVDEANQYLVEREPWKLAKDPARREELASVLYAAAESLRVLAILVSPIMPAAAGRLWADLGLSGAPADAGLAGAAWGGLKPGTTTRKGESL